MVTPEKERQILACMVDILSQNGFRSELVEPKDGAPLMLRCEAPRQGKIAKDVTVEACFIPMPLPGEDMGLLQIYATLFEGVPEKQYAQVRRSCTYCNDYCALGQFSFFQPAGQIFLKHNTLLDVSGELERIVTFFADNISLVLASVTRFIDGFASVAYSGMPLEAAIEQELFPQL